LKMVLDFYGMVVSEADLAKAAGSTREKGTTLEGIVKAAKHYGFHVFYKDNATLDDIRYFIKRDIPVMVDWFSPFGGSYDGHYSVVVDINKKEIILMDPELEKILIYARRRKLLLEDFYKLWFDFMGDFIKYPRELFLRQMFVITPFKEKFPIKASKINLTQLKKISVSEKINIAKEKKPEEKKTTVEVAQNKETKQNLSVDVKTNNQ
jgi:hypothetical protein